MNENLPVNVFVAPGYQTVATRNVALTVQMTHGNEPDVIPSDEVAKILGVTMNNLRQMVFKKRLSPVRKDGRTSMFARSDVEALAAKRQARMEKRHEG